MPAQANSFATFLIIGPTCFFLGMLLCAFPYDYNVLWRVPEDPGKYLTILEDHLKFMYDAPPLIPRILHIVLGTGLVGFITKLYAPSEANVLFDGASLVLYMIALIVYLTNVTKGLRVVSTGSYGKGDLAEEGDDPALDRVDSLRVMAASNTILALTLVGVLVLQGGQWYAEKKESAEIEAMRVADEKKKAGKKKQ